MAKATRSKAPSRIKYEQGHPTVSCRIPREFYNKLRKVNKVEGKSFADILKIGLGIIEAKVQQEGEIKKQGYAEGYKKGYAEAERLFKVTYPCNVCGKMLTVTSGDEKEAIRKYMQEHGWGHGDCHERAR